MPSILSLDAGQWQQTQLPVGPQSHWYSETANTLTTILYPYNHSVLHFQYGIQYITWSIQYFIKNRLCVQLFLPNCRLMWVFYARLRWVQLNCDVWWIMCVCSVAQPYLTLWHPMNCSLPGSSVHGILQARILLFPTPGDFPNPGIEPTPPALAEGFFTTSTTWEAHSMD